MNSDENHNLDNLKRRGFEICLAVYRVTKLFPKGEALGKQLREASSKIVVALATKQISDTILNIETIKVYLAIAKAQNWVKPINFDLLINAYGELLEQVRRLRITEEVFGKKIIRTPPPGKFFGEQATEAIPLDRDQKRVQKRQKQIVSYLKENSPAKTSEIVNFLGSVGDRTGDRTVRIDLNTLIDKGIVKKSGVNKTARYFV